MSWPSHPIDGKTHPVRLKGAFAGAGEIHPMVVPARGRSSGGVSRGRGDRTRRAESSTEDDSFSEDS